MKYLIIITTALTSIFSLLGMKIDTSNILSNQQIYLPYNHNKPRYGIVDEGELILFESAKNIAHRRIVKFKPGKPLKI